MFRNFFFCLFVVMLAALCTDAKRRKLPGGKRTSCESFGRKNSSRAICIVQHGRSGKISISLGKDRGENDPKTITIEFDAIRELDADDNQVGKTGAKEGKHSFENFASLEFEFSDLVNTSYKGIKAVGFNFSAKIPGPNATLTVPVYIFKENKTIALCDEEEIDVVRRMVKFNIEISNWNFCKAGSGCRKGQKEEIGKYIDFVITVKNKGKGKEGTKKKKQPGKKHKAQKFFFGKNSISFPSTFSADGDCNGGKMPNTYPRLKSRGGDKYSITFRFPTFNNKIVYDPAVDMEEQESPPPDDSGDDSGTKLHYPSFALVVILGVLARLFF